MHLPLLLKQLCAQRKTIALKAGDYTMTIKGDMTMSDLSEIKMNLGGSG